MAMPQYQKLKLAKQLVCSPRSRQTYQSSQHHPYLHEKFVLDPVNPGACETVKLDPFPLIVQGHLHPFTMGLVRICLSPNAAQCMSYIGHFGKRYGSDGDRRLDTRTCSCSLLNHAQSTIEAILHTNFKYTWPSQTIDSQF